MNLSTASLLKTFSDMTRPLASVVLAQAEEAIQTDLKQVIQAYPELRGIRLVVRLQDAGDSRSRISLMVCPAPAHEWVFWDDTRDTNRATDVFKMFQSSLDSLAAIADIKPTTYESFSHWHG